MFSGLDSILDVFHSGQPDAMLCGGSITWTPQVCRIMAFWPIFRGFRPLFLPTLEDLGIYLLGCLRVRMFKKRRRRVLGLGQGPGLRVVVVGTK